MLLRMEAAAPQAAGTHLERAHLCLRPPAKTTEPTLESGRGRGYGAAGAAEVTYQGLGRVTTFREQGESIEVLTQNRGKRTYLDDL